MVSAPVRRGNRDVTTQREWRKVNEVCLVPGCSGVWHRGRLCELHWNMTPFNDRLRIMADVATTARKVAERHHRRMEKALLAKLARPP